MSTGRSATSTQSVQDAKKRLREFLKDLERIPTEVLLEECPKLYSEIISEVPYDTGKLEASVRVAVAKDKRRPGINASASAHSKKEYNYAGIQHENEDFHHSGKRKHHYISDPFERCTDRIIRKTRRRLRLSKR